MFYTIFKFLNARKEVQTKRFEAETRAINEKTVTQSTAIEAQARVTTTLLDASNTNMLNLYQRLGDLELQVRANHSEIASLNQRLARYAIMFEALPIVLPEFLKRNSDLPIVMNRLKKYVEGNFNTTIETEITTTTATATATASTTVRNTAATATIIAISNDQTLTNDIKPDSPDSPFQSGTPAGTITEGWNAL